MRMLSAIAAAAVLYSATTALADSVGEVWAEPRAASVSGRVDQRPPFVAHAKVFVGDRVATGADGQVELLFDDLTLVTLSASTMLGIDDDSANKQTKALRDYVGA